MDEQSHADPAPCTRRVPAGSNAGADREGAPESGLHEEHASQAPVAPPHEGETLAGLPDLLKTGIERLSSLSMEDVTVHYHSSKPAQVQALAYTQGTDIYLGPGQEHHLAHEAWHVVQQKQGRVKPTLQARGMAINDDRDLEKEANMMGARAHQIARSTSPEEEINGPGSVELHSSPISHFQLSVMTSAEHPGSSSDGVSLDARWQSIAPLLSQGETPAPNNGLQLPGAVIQRMLTPYSRKDLGYEDPSGIDFLSETIGFIKWQRRPIPDAVKGQVDLYGDGEDKGAYKHYIPYDRICKGLLDTYVEGKKRSEIITGLTKVLAELKIQDTSGLNPKGNRVAFDSWVEWIVEGVSDWSANIYRWSDSSGDSKGTAVDTPNNAGQKLTGRLTAAAKVLQTIGIDTK